MAETDDSLSALEAPGVRVALDRGMHVASLRFFDRNGSFAQTARAITGVPLPDRLCATYAVPSNVGEPVILAWRSPSEILLLGTDDALATKLEAGVVTLNDGCIVDQTDGAWVLRASGERIADLFARVGGQAVLPALGEARRSRLADIPVLAIQVQAGEMLLVVERVYAEHLMNWLRASAADFETSPILFFKMSD